MTDHPLTETAAAELWDTHAGDTVPWDDWYGGSRRALTSLLRAAFDAGQKYQDGLKDDTIRNIMQDVHHLRVERDAAIAREAMQNMRESEQGRELMAEAWDQGWRDRRQYDQDIDWRTIPVTDANPYREGDA